MKRAAIVLACLMGIGSAAHGEEIFGTVASVDGYRVRINLEEVIRVREGDSVRLSSEIPGVGRVAIEGEWKVVEIGTGYVVADVVGEATGAPQPGYRAAIEATGEPTTTAAAAEPAARSPVEAQPQAPTPRTLTAPPPSATRHARPRGVYLAGFESGSRPVWWPVESAIRELLAECGTRLLDFPSDLPYPRTAAPAPARVLRDLAPYGGGWLLYLTVSNATGAFGKAGKDRVSIECFGPNGESHWREDTSFRLNTGRAKIANKKRVNLMIQAMRKHRGGPCLRP